MWREGEASRLQGDRMINLNHYLLWPTSFAPHDVIIEAWVQLYMKHQKQETKLNNCIAYN